MQKFYFLAAFLLLGSVSVAQDFRFGKISVEEIEEEVHPQDAEAAAAVLFRKHNVYYEYSNATGFTLITDVHERVKIYTREGFDWATKEVTYYKNSGDKEKISGIRGATYNLKGGKVTSEKLKGNGIFDEEENAYRQTTKFTMPAVKEGSVVEYRYTIRSPFLTSIDDTPLQYTIPINKLEAQVTIPEFFGFKKYFNPKSAFYLPVQESSKKFVHKTNSTQRNHLRTTTNVSSLEFLQNVYSVTAENIPPIKKEDYVDYLHNYAAFIKWELMFTKFPNASIKNLSMNWEGVAKSIYDDGGFQKEVNRDGFFKKEVDALVKDVNAPLERAALLYDFVRSKVKWNGYYGFTAEKGGKSAFNNGEGNVGDINLLLTAMLKYAGLNASPVVISTRSNGIPIYPTRNGFNYVISAIELPNNLILLDATDQNAALGELPSRARNWQGRIIREDASSDWVNLNPQQQSQERLTLSFELGDDMIMRGKSINLHNGLFAKQYRETFKDINQESLLDHFEKGKGNISISEIQQENLSLIGTDVKETYSFELQQGVDVINGKIYLKPFIFTALKENPFKADERIYPVFFEFPMLKNNTVNVLIPEGYEVESLPDSFASEINGGEGEYRFKVVQNGRFLRLESELSLKNIIFIPEHYAALKEFYAHMVDKQSEAIVLKKII